jgi:hypothetical protein
MLAGRSSTAPVEVAPKAVRAGGFQVGSTGMAGEALRAGTRSALIHFPNGRGRKSPVFLFQSNDKYRSDFHHQ